MRSEIYYCHPIFRPPSEANSLLIQATEGCTFSCDFCVSNLNKQFKIRSLEDIKKDIQTAKIIYGTQISKMFLLDGNAFVMKPDQLIEIAKFAYQIHPHLERIGIYAHAKDILCKSDEELQRIANAGIKIAYLGIETGDDEILKRINKQVTAENMVEAAHKLHQAGIILSGTIILGLAGADPEKSLHHAFATADLINHMNPQKAQLWYISALTLMLAPGTRITEQTKQGKFIPASTYDVLKELKIIIENLSENLHDCVFRSNHASNYLSLKGILIQDRKKLLNMIQYGLDHPSYLRPEDDRGL